MKRHIVILFISMILAIPFMLIYLMGCGGKYIYLSAVYSDITAIKQAVDLYEHDKNISVNVLDLPDILVENGYLKKIPTDPWLNAYIFKQNNSEIYIYSVGENGEDELTKNDDVSLSDRGNECERFGVECSYYPILHYVVMVIIILIFIYIIKFIFMSLVKSIKKGKLL